MAASITSSRACRSVSNFASKHPLCRGRFSTAATTEVQNGSKPPLSTRIRLYFKRIVDDYVWASKETVTYIKEKPVKSVTLISTVSAVGYMYANNPSMDNYSSHLSEITSDLSEVGTALRNEQKSAQLQNLISLHNEHRLRRLTLGVCSFIWVSEYPYYIDLYESHCKQVKMTWREWPQHIVDIGFMGSWLWSNEYLVDFDVNPAEWQDSETSK